MQRRHQDLDNMAKNKAQQAAIAISMKKAGKKPKMQMGGTPKPNATQTTKTVRWDGGNTGVQVPSYMVDATGNPLPQYTATVKERLKKAGKLSFGGYINRK